MLSHKFELVQYITIYILIRIVTQRKYNTESNFSRHQVQISADFTVVEKKYLKNVYQLY